MVRVALFLIGYVLILLAASIPKNMVPPRFADIVWGGVSALAILALTQLILSREGRTRRDVGLEADAGTPARLLAGLAIGAAVYGAIMGVIALALGPIRFSSPHMPDPSIWIVMVGSYVALGCMEELGFRAYALRTLIPALGNWPAQVVIAVAFGLSHIAFGWPWLSAVIGVIPSALLFGVVAVRSGGLAMPIGVHIALNVAQWLVGAKDSGGVWTLDVDPSRVARVSSVAPFVGMAITLIAVAVISRWPARREATGIP